MIISHKHKFIFLKTHKTAGTSLQIALSKHCSEDDIISILHQSDSSLINKFDGLSNQNIEVDKKYFNHFDWIHYFFRQRKFTFSEHLDAQRVKRWIGEKVWNSYYKFCFERDPLDKVISYYFWRTRSESISFEQFVLENIQSLSDFNIYSINSEIVVNKVYKYEEIEDSIHDLEEKLNLNLEFKGINAKSGFRDNSITKDSINDEMKNLILNHFHNEIIHFYPHYLGNMNKI